MWKSATTKIFLSFAFIILIVSIFSIFSFAQIVLEQEENYTYDLVASRSQALASEINDDLKKNLPIEKIVLKNKNLILKSDSSLLSGREHDFSSASIARLAPMSGSLVTKCADQSGKIHLCAFTPLENFSGWVIETTPLHSLFENLLALAMKLLPYFLVLLSLSLALAFLLSKLIFSPIKKFIEASRLISSGHYHQVDIPHVRKDELGELSQAFSKMMHEIQDREKSLARTGMKLVHSARLASLGQLGASIAHEIKNPLTAILGHAKIVQDAISDAEL
ncbi:MAG: HAMP domain-containing protein, partial [Bdellovibrionota bacterium]